MLVSYNWLKKYIPEIPKKNELIDLITFKLCELENVEDLSNGDIVFDLNILPDRAHYLLSHKGVAKEIAGMSGLKVNENILFDLIQNNSVLSNEKTELQIEVNSSLCRRYIGRVIRNIKVGPSPKWLVNCLESIGQKSINNVVDITNFVLFDLGQPIHAFDLDKLESEKLIVRNAKVGETINLLNFDNSNKSRVVKLDESNLVIADCKEPVAIAGIKGGTKAEIGQDTKNIIIEVANFDPVSIRKTARKFGIQTDAVKRYENELTPSLCEEAINEVCALINELCGEVRFEEIVDVYKEKPLEKKISFTGDYISKILGVKISDEIIEKILRNYNYEFTKDNNGVFEFIVPNNRFDLEEIQDVVEEIGRIYGYDKIIPQLPELGYSNIDNEIWIGDCLAKEKLIEDGYQEVYTYAFTDKGEIEIMASASDKNFLRTNLLDGLNKSYELNRLNAPFLGLNEIKIFEVGTVFLKSGEEMHVAYIDKKNKVEMTLSSFLSLQNLNKDFPHNLFIPINITGKKFQMWSSYPFIFRDIAVWISEDTDPEILVNIYKKHGCDLLVKEPMFVDKFIKNGRVSYSYRLIFQSYERTLTDEEINKIMLKISDEVKSIGFEVR